MNLQSVQHTKLLTESLMIANSLLIQMLDNIDHLYLKNLDSDLGSFVELTTLITKLASNSGQFVDSVRDSHIELLNVLKAIKSARENADAIAVEELIKYELKDTLTQWKIDLIPHLKKLIAR